MGVEPPRPIVRARQRSRTALRAFARALVPVAGEVGIDRFQMSVEGGWREAGAAYAGGLTAEEYFEALSTGPLDVDWFRVPARSPEKLVITSRSNSRSTISDIRISVTGRQSNRGRLSIKLSGNPTRTLAHLLADLGNSPEFLERVAGLSPFEFFASASTPIPRALGSTPDNWLPDADQVLQRLGVDPFAAFLPVYVAQLQALVGALIAPSSEATSTSDGCDTKVVERGLVGRLHWGDVRVPQIETYFERHHGGAVASVRAAASVALAEVDHADAWRYARLTSDWVERLDDCLAIGFPLNQKHRMKIYAKSASRIRFEVRRLGKGDYTTLDRPERPQERLLAILNMERGNLLTAARWSSIGLMFDEQPHPQINDLTRLCSLVAGACSDSDVEFQPILARLLEDGGISLEGHVEVHDALLTRLCSTGVLRRVSLVRRDHRRPVKRYALTPEYRHLVEAVTLALGAYQ